MSDMLESGVPVVNGYVSDIHGNEDIPALSSACKTAPGALGSGSACYIAQAQYYNQAFGAFFKRLAAEGITPQNTEFLLSSDEGDHEAGANVGRAIQPTPASCDGATVTGTTVSPDALCTYPAGSFGELDGNITGLLATENNTTPEFYVTGKPAPDAPQVRKLEQDVGGLTAANPYTGTTQDITNYLADPTDHRQQLQFPRGYIATDLNGHCGTRPSRRAPRSSPGWPGSAPTAQIGPDRPRRRLLRPPRPRPLVTRP